MGLKAQIIDYAMRLMELLEQCDDDDFIDTVVNSVYANDVAPLWDLDENLY